MKNALVVEVLWGGGSKEDLVRIIEAIETLGFAYDDVGEDLVFTTFDENQASRVWEICLIQGVTNVLLTIES